MNPCSTLAYIIKYSDIGLMDLEKKLLKPFDMTIEGKRLTLKKLHFRYSRFKDNLCLKPLVLFSISDLRSITL